MAEQKVELKELALQSAATAKRLRDLERTITQLRNGEPIPSSAPISTSPDSVSVPRAVLADLRQKLIASRDEITRLTSENQKKDTLLAQQAKTLATVKAKVAEEVTAVRKEILIRGMTCTPEEFRRSLEKQLRAVREEVLKVQAQKGGVPREELLSIRKNLVSIRGKLVEREAAFEKTKAQIQKKVRSLADAVRALDAEKHQVDVANKKLSKRLHALERENEGFRNGDRIPARLQAELKDRLQLLKEATFQVETENVQLRMGAQPDPLRNIPHQGSLSVVDMHTGGEPLRIVQSGIPALKGATLLEKRQEVMNSYDHFRRMLMFEPRGHFDMYGAIITDADDAKEADFGVLFMHNHGYSSMCGHAVIALGRYAVDFGIGSVEKPSADFNGEKTVRIQTPCGVVTVHVEVKNGVSSGKVRFLSAPAWAESVRHTLKLEQYGRVEVDIAYGGTYYAILPATRFQLDVAKAPVGDLIAVGALIKQAASKRVPLNNPDSKDLEFIYGTILTDGAHQGPSLNVTVFADRQVDRCPTGSGVLARMAVDLAKGLVKVGEKREFLGRTGAAFTGEIKETLEYKGKQAVRVEVGGEAHYCGRSTFYLENGDQLGAGFLIQ